MLKSFSELCFLILKEVHHLSKICSKFSLILLVTYSARITASVLLVLFAILYKLKETGRVHEGLEFDGLVLQSLSYLFCQFPICLHECAFDSQVRDFSLTMHNDAEMEHGSSLKWIHHNLTSPGVRFTPRFASSWPFKLNLLVMWVYDLCWNFGSIAYSHI